MNWLDFGNLSVIQSIGSLSLDFGDGRKSTIILNNLKLTAGFPTVVRTATEMMSQRPAKAS
jgi:hypothetical protein